jgi:hypothetical protein
LISLGVFNYLVCSLSPFQFRIFAIAGSGPEAEAAELRKTLPAPLPAPTAKETGYAKVNGAEIYYAIYGSGEPLILLHGGLGNTDYWGGQIIPGCQKRRSSLTSLWHRYLKCGQNSQTSHPSS